MPLADPVALKAYDLFMQFAVYLTQDRRKQLTAVMDAERARIRLWWIPRKKRLARIEKPSELAKARGQYKDKFARAVAQGALVPSRGALLASAVVAELDQRGRTGPYQSVPAGGRGPGRRWGSTNIPGSTRRVVLELPAEIGERLERACYWENLDLASQLEQFYDVFGDSPDLPDPRPGESPGVQAMRYRDQLRADITTTGDILREAVDRVLCARTEITEPEKPSDGS
ncbi:hypothetical protein ACIA5G_50975 [Amycolatopsis sp. NPDC051758]|uniref:hypothetical protein n=1 Tax=Amycolatopsis sp. NPDC051758 TaxID=3363935 RepID=UPI0037991FC4